MISFLIQFIFVSQVHAVIEYTNPPADSDFPRSSATHRIDEASESWIIPRIRARREVAELLRKSSKDPEPQNHRKRLEATLDEYKRQRLKEDGSYSELLERWRPFTRAPRGMDAYLSAHLVRYPFMHDPMPHDPLQSTNLAAFDQDIRSRYDAIVHRKKYPTPSQHGLSPPFPGPRTILRTNSLPSSLWRVQNKLRFQEARRTIASASAQKALKLFMDNSILVANTLRYRRRCDTVEASNILNRLAQGRFSAETEKTLQRSLAGLSRSIADADSRLERHVSAADTLWKAGLGAHNFQHRLERGAYLWSFPNDENYLRKAGDSQMRSDRRAQQD